MGGSSLLGNFRAEMCREGWGENPYQLTDPRPKLKVYIFCYISQLYLQAVLL
jgi:hypothetical protein